MNSPRRYPTLLDLSGSSTGFLGKCAGKVKTTIRLAARQLDVISQVGQERPAWRYNGKHRPGNVGSPGSRVGLSESVGLWEIALARARAHTHIYMSENGPAPRFCFSKPSADLRTRGRARTDVARGSALGDFHSHCLPAGTAGIIMPSLDSLDSGGTGGKGRGEDLIGSARSSAGQYDFTGWQQPVN